MSAPVVLLSCVKSKRDRPCKAGEMYTSPLFQKMMAYAQSLKPRNIYILSAKYGLLSTDTIIEPYEQTLIKMKSAERRRWAQDVISELRMHCDLNSDCKIARNIDPGPAGSQRIDLVVKDPNLAGSRVAPNRDPTQETNSPAQSVAYMYSQVGSPLEAISQADYRTGEECQR
jgi:hypothetical protein